MQKLGNKNLIRNLNLHEMTLSDISAADFLVAMNESHTADIKQTGADKGHDTATISEITPFQAYMTDKKPTVDKPLHPAHLQCLMSSKNSTQTPTQVLTAAATQMPYISKGLL